MADKHVTDLVIHVGTQSNHGGDRWTPTIRVSGRVDGRPFLILHDLYTCDFPSERAAIAAGESEAQRRVHRIRAGIDAP